MVTKRKATWWHDNDDSEILRYLRKVSTHRSGIFHSPLSTEIKSWIKGITIFRPIRRTIPGPTYRLYVVLNLQLNQSSLKVALVPIHSEYIKMDGVGISRRVWIGVEWVLWDDFWSQRFTPRSNEIFLKQM